jgi:hypothetical protein
LHQADEQESEAEMHAAFPNEECPRLKAGLAHVWKVPIRQHPAQLARATFLAASVAENSRNISLTTFPALKAFSSFFNLPALNHQLHKLSKLSHSHTPIILFLQL